MGDVEYTGTDRRQIADMSTLASLVADIRDDVKELRSAQRSIAHDVKCLAQEMQKHQPLLDRLTISEIDAKKLRGAVVEKTIAGVVWAAIIGIAMSVWLWVKENVNKG